MARPPILYVPDVKGDELILPKEEAQHAIKVLRLQEGNELRLVDGRGGLYKASVQGIDKKECKVRIEDEVQAYGERPYRLTMAVAPTKNDQRFEWFLEKATEMGVDRIIPLLSKRSEKTKIKTERFHRILVAAMKQSNRAYLPELSEPMALEDLLLREEGSQGFIAHCYQEPERKALKDAYRIGSDAIVLIGPEGDFTPEEVDRAIESGYESVSLGKAVLRTETAAVAACHTIALMNQG